MELESLFVHLAISTPHPCLCKCPLLNIGGKDKIVYTFCPKGACNLVHLIKGQVILIANWIKLQGGKFFKKSISESLISIFSPRLLYDDGRSCAVHLFVFPQSSSFEKSTEFCQKKLMTCCKFNYVQFINTIRAVNKFIDTARIT